MDDTTENVFSTTSAIPAATTPTDVSSPPSPLITPPTTPPTTIPTTATTEEPNLLVPLLSLSKCLKDQDGGYDVDLADRDDLPHDLKCIICWKLMREPVELGCGHGYCSSCFDRVKKESFKVTKCPHCRASVNVKKVFVNKMLKRYIASLRVKCGNSYRGCKWTGDVGNLEDHSCDYQMMSCTKCNAEMERHLSKNHSQSCSNHKYLAKKNEELQSTIDKQNTRITELETDLEKSQTHANLMNASCNMLTQKVRELEKELTSSRRGDKHQPIVIDEHGENIRDVINELNPRQQKRDDCRFSRQIGTKVKYRDDLSLCTDQYEDTKRKPPFIESNYSVAVPIDDIFQTNSSLEKKYVPSFPLPSLSFEAFSSTVAASDLFGSLRTSLTSPAPSVVNESDSGQSTVDDVQDFASFLSSTSSTASFLSSPSSTIVSSEPIIPFPAPSTTLPRHPYCGSVASMLRNMFPSPSAPLIPPSPAIRSNVNISNYFPSCTTDVSGDIDINEDIDIESINSFRNGAAITSNIKSPLNTTLVSDVTYLSTGDNESDCIDLTTY